MEVIIDTNVFISGIFWQGESRKVINCWKDNMFILVTSMPIVLELYRILLNFKIKLPEEEMMLWTNLILANSKLVEPKQKLNIIKEDPNDNMFLEAAEESDADFIITQDNHLLKINKFKNTKILTPEEFIIILQNNNL